MRKIIFISLLLPSVVSFSQNHLRLEDFKVGDQIKEYPSFKITDTIPKWTGFINRKFHHYLHDDASSYLFLYRPVYFIIAATNLHDEIISISIVTKFDVELLNDLQNKYGRWDTASLGSIAESYDSLDTSKFSYYIWKVESGSIGLIINRFMTQPGVGIDTKDYAIISMRSKDYWDSK